MKVLTRAILVSALLLPALAEAAPPKVVSIVPENGDQEVSADVTEIRVVFDQPMGEGASWVGQGDFIDGPFKWTDNKTCVLPVKLKPGQDYRLSINSQRFTYFRSVKGEVAEPFPFSFRTAGGKPAPAMTPQTNRKSIEQLRAAIETHYSYRDRVVRDWDALFAQHAGGLEKAGTRMAFAEAAAKLLSSAQDAHIWLKVGEQTVGSHQRAIEPNFNLQALTGLPGWKQHNDVVATARLGQDVAYLQIRSWAFADAAVLDPAFAFLDSLNASHTLILDVRPNAGGEELKARLLAGCFVGAPVTYSQHRNITGVATGPDRFSKVYERVLQPNTQHKPFAGAGTYVLMGPVNMSSCESFLLMMKQAPNTTLVGARSYGSSGNPKPHSLANGVEVFLPSWQDLDEAGKQVEGIGVEPDVEVVAKAEDFDSSDPVLSKAFKLALGQE